MMFTAVFLKISEGYIGFVAELPGANTQAIPSKKLVKICARPSKWYLRRIANQASKHRLIKAWDGFRVGRIQKRDEPA